MVVQDDDEEYQDDHHKRLKTFKSRNRCDVLIIEVFAL